MGVSVAFRVMINYLLSVGVPVAFRVMINYLLSVGVPVALTIDVCRVKKNRKRPERDTLRMEMFLIKVQAERDNALSAWTATAAAATNSSSSAGYGGIARDVSVAASRVRRHCQTGTFCFSAPHFVFTAY